MKKILITFVAAAFGASTLMNAQVAKKPLYEEATNASCGPCASQNPDYNQDLHNNAGNVVSIKYQWYFPGTDPMHSQNVADANARVSYYGINGVPTVATNGAIQPDLGGNAYNGAPVLVTQSTINTNLAETTPLSMNLSHSLNAALDSVFIDVIVKNEGTSAWPAGHKLQVVLQEELITFASSPGSNGETVFENVMRDMYPSNTGTAMAGIPAGDSLTFTFSEALPNYLYSVSQVAVAAFVQDDATKAVHQAEYSPPYTPPTAFDVSLNSSHTINLCTDVDFTPSVLVENATSNVVTSVQVSYSLDGGTPVTQNVTGLNLAQGQSTTVNFPTITTPGKYSVLYNVDNINGTEQDYVGSNNGSAFDISILTVTNQNTITVRITPDNYGSETTWRVINKATNAIVGQGGPYTDGVTTTTNTPVTLPTNDCYEFLIFDTYGDGICCSWGVGSYSILDAGNNVLHTGGEFTNEDNFGLELDLVSSTEGISYQNNIQIVPNPVRNQLTLNYNTDNAVDATITIMNALGQQVLFVASGMFEGDNTMDVNTSTLASGVYFMHVNSTEGISTQRFVVEK